MKSGSEICRIDLAPSGSRMKSSNQILSKRRLPTKKSCFNLIFNVLWTKKLIREMHKYRKRRICKKQRTELKSTKSCQAKKKNTKRKLLRIEKNRPRITIRNGKAKGKKFKMKIILQTQMKSGSLKLVPKRHLLVQKEKQRLLPKDQIIYLASVLIDKQLNILSQETNLMTVWKSQKENEKRPSRIDRNQQKIESRRSKQVFNKI